MRACTRAWWSARSVARSIAFVFLLTGSASGQPLPTAPTGSGAGATAEATRINWWQGLRAVSLGDVVSAAVTVLVVFTVLWLANRLHHRLVKLVSSYGHRGSAVEQENRARTLVGVLHNALRTIVIAVGAIMVLEQIHIPVTPLLGGVAVVGLAVAFGAQSLIKDYFTGFLILLEQQYMIGDVIKIGATTGQVERITLRLTVLRDIEGSVHFVPHGQINVVSNLTHGWSQAVFELHVPAGEQVERVRDVFLEVAEGLRGDPVFGPMTQANAEMLGMDAIGESTYSVKFVFRTLPLKRWDVRREMLRRLRERFQKLQIKVTVPG